MLTSQVTYSFLCLGIWWRHEIWRSEILKFDFLRNKRAFEVKWKIFFLVWQLLLFRLKKQTSKNVADKPSRRKNFKPIYRERTAEGLRGGLAEKRRVVFLRGLIPQCTLWCVFCLFTPFLSVFFCFTGQT